MKISLVINCDTRPENNTFGGSNLMGCANEDFLIEGVRNKMKFFDGFDLEVIVYVDQHKFLSEWNLHEIRCLWSDNPEKGNTGTIIVRDHTDEIQFNDNNYLRALQLASGDYIVHIDQDTALFSSGIEAPQRLIELLDEYAYISYPSLWTPYPVIDPSFDHIWVSTRFFMCKRETIDFAEVLKCKNDYNYWCETYPVNRKCAWLEHWLGSIAKYRNQSVFYPPIEPDKYLIFSWGSYRKGVLQELNNMNYEEVKEWVRQRGIHYPNDVNV